MVQIKNPLTVIGSSATPGFNNIYEEISWYADQGEAQDRYPVGTMIDVDTGEIVTTEISDHLTMRITGYSGVIQESDGTQKQNRPQLQAVRVSSTTRRFGSNTTTSQCEWRNSELRVWLNQEYIISLPVNFQKSIKTSIVTTLAKATSSAATTTYETQDKLYLLSYNEVGGSSASPYSLEGNLQTFYASEDAVQKRIAYDEAGIAQPWWTRTPTQTSNAYVWRIGNDGRNFSGISPTNSSTYVRIACNL